MSIQISMKKSAPNTPPPLLFSSGHEAFDHSGQQRESLCGVRNAALNTVANYPETPSIV